MPWTQPAGVYELWLVRKEIPSATYIPSQLQTLNHCHCHSRYKLGSGFSKNLPQPAFGRDPCVIQDHSTLHPVHKSKGRMRSIKVEPGLELWWRHSCIRVASVLSRLRRSREGEEIGAERTSTIAAHIARILSARAGFDKSDATSTPESYANGSGSIIK